MTIKGLQTDQPGLPRAGIIRLGYKVDTGKKDRNGNPLMRPVEAPHFVLTDAPGLAEALGTSEPTELKIYFPFDSIDLVFPAFMQFWQASSLVCRGDGEQIIYAIDPQTGKAKVRDGLALYDFTEGGKNYSTGEFMACPGTDRNLYPKCAHCKPNAMLIVLLRDVPRLAYYQIATTSIHNIIDLTKQLTNIRDTLTNIIGVPKLTGVPFILKRIKRKISVPKGENGRQRVEKYFLELEIDPDWVLKMLVAQRRLADPLERLALPATVPAPMPQMDIIDAEPTVPQKPPFGFAEPPTWEAPLDEVEAEEEVTPDPSPAPEEPKAPAPAPAASQPTTTNGNGDVPRTPQALLDTINRRVEATYDNLYHLENAIRKELGKGWKWPKSNDVAGWKAAYDAAYGHAMAKMVPAPVEGEQLGLIDDEDLDDVFPRVPDGIYQD
jgi:hypothetical protein